MSGRDRFVVVGLARPRSTWFADVGRWSTGATLPIDFRKCVSPAELRAHLQSPTALSALLVDGGLGVVDLDLVAAATAAGCAVLVVDDGRRRADWRSMGVHAVLPEQLEPGALLEALVDHATPVRRADGPVPEPAAAALPRTWRGRLVAVVGAGGSGTSVTSMAVAQGLGADPRHRGRVVLADLALDADQAVLHDVGDVVPGVQELVEAHRSSTPSAEEIRDLCFADPERRYALLLGLRRHRDWTTLRPRAVGAAVDGLRRAFTAVVCDCDPDLEGEEACGSVDIEDRNVLARTAVTEADVVVVTGRPSPQGLHRLVRLLGEVRRLGVAPARILPTVVAAPRAARSRAELSAAIHSLERPDGADPVNPVLFLPERRRLDQLLVDGRPLPTPLATAAAEAVHAVIQQAARSAARSTPVEPVPIRPGTLGSWTEQEATG